MAGSTLLCYCCNKAKTTDEPVWMAASLAKPYAVVQIKQRRRANLFGWRHGRLNTALLLLLLHLSKDDGRTCLGGGMAGSTLRCCC
jgi:hypothetical protein